MCRRFKATIGIAMTLALLFAETVRCFGAEEIEIKTRGLIVGRTGDTLAVKTGDGNITVVLTDSTKAQKPKGLGLRKAQMSFSAFVPGLRITVAGVYDAHNRLVAKTITFSGRDLQAAEAIQAGLTPTQQAVDVNQQNIKANRVQIAANQERIGANEKHIAENDQEIKKCFRALLEPH